MTDVLKEQNFQLSPHCGDSYTCLKEAGRILGVNRLVIGTVNRVGSLYSIHLRLVDVQTSLLPSQPAKGGVHIAGEFRGAEVWLNQKQVGKVPLSLSLSPGEYQLEVKQVGYQTWQSSLQIQSENTLEIRPELQREEPHWGIMIGVFSSLLLILADSLLQRGPGQGLQRADMYITQQ